MVVDLSTIDKTVLDRFDAVAVSESMPTQYPNKAFAPPANSKWCRAFVTHGRSWNPLITGIALDTGMREECALVVESFWPIGAGSKPATDFAHTVGQAFRTRADAGIRYRSRQIDQMGITPSQKWFQVNIRIPFVADEKG